MGKKKLSNKEKLKEALKDTFWHIALSALVMIILSVIYFLTMGGADYTQIHYAIIISIPWILISAPVWIGVYLSYLILYQSIKSSKKILFAALIHLFFGMLVPALLISIGAIYYSIDRETGWYIIMGLYSMIPYSILIIANYIFMYMRKEDLFKKMTLSQILRIVGVTIVIIGAVYGLYWVVQEELQQQVAGVKDPCWHIGLDEFTVIGDVGTYAKPSCYFSEAHLTMDVRICEFLGDKNNMGKTYAAFHRGNCISMIAMDTMNVSLCKSIRDMEIFKQCNRVIHNNIRSRCKWGDREGVCLRELSRNLEEASRPELKGCKVDADCTMTTHEYGTCCRYCAKSVNVKTAAEIEKWFEKSCPNEGDPPICLATECSTTVTSKCEKNICVEV